jgi:hypothetical protein
MKKPIGVCIYTPIWDYVVGVSSSLAELHRVHVTLALAPSEKKKKIELETSHSFFLQIVLFWKSITLTDKTLRFGAGTGAQTFSIN